MQLSVCIDALYMNKNFSESVKAVRSAGYDTIEFWSWWDKDLEVVEQVIKETDTRVAAFCTKFVSLVDASKRDEYICGLQESITVAKRLDCRQLISQVGQQLPDISRQEQKRSLIDGLKACVPILERECMTLLIEPLNILVDHHGYYLDSSVEAFDIIRKVGSKHIKVLYDIYHQQITEGNIISTISRNIEWIGHFHAAGNPGRHELNTGELDYSNIFAAIEQTEFSGFVGLEYFPTEDPAEGLRLLKNLLKQEGLQ